MPIKSWLVSAGVLFFILSLLANGLQGTVFGAAQKKKPAPLPPTLGLEQGLIEFETPEFKVKIVRASQTMAALQPKGADGFDFTPSDLLHRRAADGFHHLGDLTLRLRTGKEGQWISYSTAASRTPVTPLIVSGSQLAAADLTPTLPETCPLRIIRSWELKEGKLILTFEIENRTDQVVQIGALGFPMIFNNILTRRSLEQAHEVCSFFDPYMGKDAGCLQVTRLSGRGPALLAVPEGQTPFEAYRPLSEPMHPMQTFEGVFEWMVHSRAYAETEWNQADPWNPPTQTTIAPGDRKSYGIRFLLAPEIRAIEDTLKANNRPVAIGIPGYILPMDLAGRLFLYYGKPVVSLKAEPAGAIDITNLALTTGGWQSYELKGMKWGRIIFSVIVNPK